MTGFVAKRRGNRRRYAIALGLGFHPRILAAIAHAACVGGVMVGNAHVCKTVLQGLAVVPKGGVVHLAPAHREAAIDRHIGRRWDWAVGGWVRTT